MSLEQKLHRIEALAREGAGGPKVENEMRALLRDLYKMLNDAAKDTGGISSYISEKLAGLESFALMAISAEDRGGYTEERIHENIVHFAYLVRTRT